MLIDHIRLLHRKRTLLELESRRDAIFQTLKRKLNLLNRKIQEKEKMCVGHGENRSKIEYENNRALMQKDNAR